jgi:hypothetical protein
MRVPSTRALLSALPGGNDLTVLYTPHSADSCGGSFRAAHGEAR